MQQSCHSLHIGELYQFLLYPPEIRLQIQLPCLPHTSVTAEESRSNAGRAYEGFLSYHLAPSSTLQ